MSVNLSLVFKALDFAARKHRDQRRKDVKATPYINHPIAVARLLVESGETSDPVLLAAALLHDTLEDTETSFEELSAEFGPEVAGIVFEVTDDKTLDKCVRKAKQVEKAPTLSAKAKLVKLSDKTCNLRDILSNPPADWDDQKKWEYFSWAQDVVGAMGEMNSVILTVFDRVIAHGAANSGLLLPRR